jgi:hypothetical protein
MSLERRPSYRSVIDILERVLEKGMIVPAWLISSSFSVPAGGPPRKTKAPPSRRRTASRPPRKAPSGD